MILAISLLLALIPQFSQAQAEDSSEKPATRGVFSGEHSKETTNNYTL